MLDPELLATFVAVAETGTFTAAARRLGVSQPTVSNHVRSLENATGKRLIDRDTRNLALTDDGDALVGFAHTILDAQTVAENYFAGAAVVGRLRFGTVEDLAITQLPRILRRFRQLHPDVDLELTVDQSIPLTRKLRAGRLDLILIKWDPDEPTVGIRVGRDQLVWVGQETLGIPEGTPVPLVANRAPSITRQIAIRALEGAGLTWRITCSTRQVNGMLAAVRAGLGAAILPRSLLPTDLALVGDRLELPPLGDVDFTLIANPLTAPGPLDALSNAIRGEVLRAAR